MSSCSLFCYDICLDLLLENMCQTYVYMPFTNKEIWSQYVPKTYISFILENVPMHVQIFVN
jgi:hypothetical protein